MDALNMSFETRITALHDAAAAEKQQYERALNDFQQQVDRLTQKSHADKRFINELSADRESEREEMLKLTSRLEEAWSENDRQTEKITSLQQTTDELESQLRSVVTQSSSLDVMQKRLREDLQARDELLRRREEVVSDLERQLSQRDQQELDHQKQMEMLKMELSGFLGSPPASPEPSLNDCKHFWWS